MSECVVRMEIPKNCWVCPFGLDGYIWNENDARAHYLRFCSRHSGEEFHVLETDTIDRPWFCDSFICQLPEGHGRLVDADKEIDFHVNDFERLTAEDIDVYSKAYSLSDLCDGITYAYDHADIIVPAETERSET